MEITENFERTIAPFFWVDHDESASVCLNASEYLQDVFDERAGDGFEGNGYDWASLAQVFLDEKCPHLLGKVDFDPEGSMFCAYSEDADALREFILKFKEACENRMLIADLFSRAKLD